MSANFFISSWQKYLMFLFSLLGAGLFSSGVITWIAANWDKTTKFQKLTGSQILLTLLVIIGIWLYQREAKNQPAEKFKYKAALLWFCAAVITGGLFALIGQIYQTGADPWQLFALWSLLQIPLLLALPNIAGGLLLIATLNLSVSLNEWLLDTYSYYPIIGLNLILLGLSEYFVGYFKDHWRVMPKVLSLFLTSFLIVNAFLYDGIPLLLLFCIFGGLLFVYLQYRRDLVNFVVYYIGLITVINTSILMNEHYLGGLVELAIGVGIILTVIATIILGILVKRLFQGAYPKLESHVVIQLFYLFAALLIALLLTGFLILTTQSESAVLVVAIMMGFAGFASYHTAKYFSPVMLAISMVLLSIYLVYWSESYNHSMILIGIPFYLAVYYFIDRKWVRIVAVGLILFSLFHLFNEYYTFSYEGESSVLSKDFNAFLYLLFNDYAFYWLALGMLGGFYFTGKLKHDTSAIGWAFLVFHLINYYSLRIDVITQQEAEALPEIHSFADFVNAISHNFLEDLYPFDFSSVLVVLLTFAVCFAPLIIFVFVNKQQQTKNSVVLIAGFVLFGLAFIGSLNLSLFLALLLVAYLNNMRTLFVFSMLLVIGFLGTYYYSLAIPLLYKSFLLLSCGLLFGMLAIYLYRQHRDPQSNVNIVPKGGYRKRAPLFVLSSLVCSLGLANYSIVENEQILTKGEPIILELAPFDPRSIMQGDYMWLNYQLLSQVSESLLNREDLPNQIYALLKVDASGVATLCRIASDRPQQFEGCAMNLYVPIKHSKWGFSMAGQEYFFAEGKAAHYNQAKYGEFRFKDGRVLLLRLLDEQLKPL
ncbi:GDYXXLXY domain-containing protein [Glaesserella sp.]|uniref:GDYXXLXY domain-containing protein n=1 Tax=Glaesserella sp. TaxID=2094731 RepID=UPI00359FEA83